VAECFGKARPAPQLFFLNQYKDLFNTGGQRTVGGGSLSSAPGGLTTFILDKDYENYPTEVASCCKPVPGDQVVGIVQDGKIMVHRSNCKHAMNEMANHENRTVRAKWRQGEQLSLLTGIALTAIDNKGLLQEITRNISEELDLNMRAITLEASEGVAQGIIMLYINNVESLNGLIERLKAIDGVEDVHRI
jgi:GTP pyrophosphokinase